MLVFFPRSGVPYSFFLDRYADSYVNIMSAFVNFVKTGDESLEPALGIDGKVTIFIGEPCMVSHFVAMPVANVRCSCHIRSRVL